MPLNLAEFVLRVESHFWLPWCLEPLRGSADPAETHQRDRQGFRIMDEEGYSTLEVRSRAVRAVLRCRSMADVADAYDTDRLTVFRWVRRYQQEGDVGLQRRPGSGRPRKLQELEEDELQELVLRPASDFGYETDLWTVGRLHGVICKEYHVVICKDTLWRRLREAGLTYQKARTTIL